MNFEFKDDLQVESERDHIQNVQSTYSEIPFMDDFNSTESKQNTDLDEFRRTELEA